MKINNSLIYIQQNLRAGKNQRNSYGGYKYRSCEDILEAVKPLLEHEKVVLVLTDEIALVGDRYYVKATATLKSADEQISNSAYAREAEKKKGMDESQITGTASSYARKYALNGLFCIDDAKDADTDEFAKATGRTRTEARSTRSREPGEENPDMSDEDLLKTLKDYYKKYERKSETFRQMWRTTLSAANVKSANDLSKESLEQLKLLIESSLLTIESECEFN